MTEPVTIVIPGTRRNRPDTKFGSYGIAYKITNLVNAAGYIGITRKGLYERWDMHVKASKRADSGSALYRAMRKYGSDKFSIETIAHASDLRRLNEFEIQLVDLYRTHVRHGGYNLTGGGEGTPDISDETRERMRVAARARMANPEIKSKMIASLTGRKSNPASVAKGAATRTGRPLSAEHRASLSAAQKGRVITPEHRAKISATLKANPFRADPALISERVKQAHARPEVKERVRQGLLRRWARHRGEI